MIGVGRAWVARFERPEGFWAACHRSCMLALTQVSERGELLRASGLYVQGALHANKRHRTIFGAGEGVGSCGR